jgi:hypothetical protein
MQADPGRQFPPAPMPMPMPAPHAMAVAPVPSQPTMPGAGQMPIGSLQGPVQIQQAMAPAPADIPSAPAIQTGVSQPSQGSRPFHTPTAAAFAAAQVDPSVAPTWLKAVAFTTIASAATVLIVLGWMISLRF